MSYSILVQCKSTESLTRREIAEFIEDGVYFDKVTFEPPAASNEMALPDWNVMQLRYAEGLQPVVIRRNAGADVRELPELVVATLGEHDLRVSPELASDLAKTTQVYEFQFHRGGEISEDCWAMMDCLEAHLARSRGGIVLSPDDGIYDADLQPKIRW